MKHNSKTVKTTSYVAGIFAIASALLVMVLLLMSAIGFLFPRKEKITLHTDTLSKTYDATPIAGGELTVTYGALHPGHELVVTVACEYTNVGEYQNKPTYMIVDASGADVTDMYDIHTDFGDIIIDSRPLVVHSASKEKHYDGTALVSDEIVTTGGSLAEGHSLVCHSKTDITYPGEQEILPTYSIVDPNGADVTDQYRITNKLGTLTVHPLWIYVQTASDEKIYDGRSLSVDEWKHIGDLLDGHELFVDCITEAVDVGSYENKAEVWVQDENGNDVSGLYDINIGYGTLTVSPVSLHIQTGSAAKEYDGIPLSNETWNIVSGALVEGERITMLSSAVLSMAGNAANKMHFAITDAEGRDVSHRYQITQDMGTLSVTPRAITLRTGSAAKMYDGTALTCEEYEIVNGSLCKGETLKAAFTSIINVGYTQNYIIDYAIHKVDEYGRVMDVGGNYRVSYDYGTLTVTAK